MITYGRIEAMFYLIFLDVFRRENRIIPDEKPAVRAKALKNMTIPKKIDAKIFLMMINPK